VIAAYEHVEQMRLSPLDKKALLVSVVAVVLTMLPLVATRLPLAEIITKLGEFML
jgi:hypothetical protein